MPCKVASSSNLVLVGIPESVHRPERELWGRLPKRTCPPTLTAVLTPLANVSLSFSLGLRRGPKTPRLSRGRIIHESQSLDHLTFMSRRQERDTLLISPSSTAMSVKTAQNLAFITKA